MTQQRPTKFYAISKWHLTGKEFVSSLMGCATAEQAEAEAREKAARYEDQDFVRVVTESSVSYATKK